MKILEKYNIKKSNKKEEVQPIFNEPFVAVLKEIEDYKKDKLRFKFKAGRLNYFLIVKKEEDEIKRIISTLTIPKYRYEEKIDVENFRKAVKEIDNGFDKKIRNLYQELQSLRKNLMPKKEIEKIEKEKLEKISKQILKAEVEFQKEEEKLKKEALQEINKIPPVKSSNERFEEAFAGIEEEELLEKEILVTRFFEKERKGKTFRIIQDFQGVN